MGTNVLDEDEPTTSSKNPKGFSKTRGYIGDGTQNQGRDDAIKGLIFEGQAFCGAALNIGSFIGPMDQFGCEPTSHILIGLGIDDARHGIWVQTQINAGTRSQFQYASR